MSIICHPLHLDTYLLILMHGVGDFMMILFIYIIFCEVTENLEQFQIPDQYSEHRKFIKKSRNFLVRTKGRRD